MFWFLWFKIMTNRFVTLDGWRGISILFVLSGHLLPLGPKFLQLNSAVATAGMAMFFILSGFLITNILLKDQDITKFIIRRFMRIIPLAWLIIMISLVSISADIKTYFSHLFFYANLGDIDLALSLAHFWSLCVEMQFYVAVAILVAVLKSRSLYLIPVFCIGITMYRYTSGVEISINTHYRIDEILAGCMLALFYNLNHVVIKKLFSYISPIYLLPLLILSAHPDMGVFNYFRPYMAMLLIASTLHSSQSVWWYPCLTHRVLIYIATISYALYIFHGTLNNTWLGEGDTFEKYMKRPLLFATTFFLAHLSTFYYEKRWITLGKKLTK